MKRETTMKIALIGARLSMNLGGPSLLVSTKTVLDSVVANAEYTLFVPRAAYEPDRALAASYGVEIAPMRISPWILPMAVIRRASGILIGPRLHKTMIRALEGSDAVIDIWGIMFADTLGPQTFKGRFVEGLRLLVARVLGKRIAKYTADIGPFTRRWNRFFARLYLQRCLDLILARDAKTKTDVEQLGVSTSVHQVPDTAFMLEPRRSEASDRLAGIRKQRSLICVSVSYRAKLNAKEPREYTESMVALVRHLLDEHGAHVILLPNELSDGPDDDRREADTIHAKVADARCEVVHVDRYLAQEIKGIIQQSDVVVAARYHTIVAALSMGIPTLAIGWHHKYEGVLSLFRQEKRVCDVAALHADALVQEFEALWKDREEARKTIAECLPRVKDRIREGARQVADWLQTIVNAQ